MLSSLTFFACSVIVIKPTETILILISLKPNHFIWTFKFFRDLLEIISSYVFLHKIERQAHQDKNTRLSDSCKLYL